MIMVSQYICRSRLQLSHNNNGHNNPGLGFIYAAKKLMRRLRTTITAHLADSKRGEILRSGLRLAIFGPPNAGKSSLLNYFGACPLIRPRASVRSASLLPFPFCHSLSLSHCLTSCVTSWSGSGNRHSYSGHNPRCCGTDARYRRPAGDRS